jgi:toxin-antitoxin system PIN domain toxin
MVQRRPIAGPAVPAAAGAQVHLLDGNVLIALVSDSHVHHQAASAWFAGHAQPFATCPITQGTLLRLLMRLAGWPVQQALAVLAGIAAHPLHRFWPDTLDYQSVTWMGVLGHRQVTDAYLAALARHHGGRLVTFDAGLAQLHADVAIALAD